MSAVLDPLAPAKRLAEQLAQAGCGEARVAVVLGSGLGVFVDGLEDVRELDSRRLTDLPESRVPGHAGRVLVGTLGGVQVLVQMGRVHLYEGWSAFEVTRAVRAFAELGVETVLLTNAGGSLDEERRPGTFLALEDHLNLQGRTPLVRGEESIGSPYDRALLDLLEGAAAEHGVVLARGVYAGVLGPSYETRAEVRALRAMGASAVGMSTVCEATAAAVAGLRVGALSCLTNFAAGVGPEPLDHEDVVRAGAAAAPELVRLLSAVVIALGGEDSRRGL